MTIDGLPLGVVKASSNQVRYDRHPLGPVCRASDFAVVNILLHASQLTISGVRKPTGQLKRSFAVAGTKASQQQNFFALQNVIPNDLSLLTTPKGNPSLHRL